MFPNPQDALPLPLRPNLERYKKLAKDLIKACKSVDADAFGDWAEAWVKTLIKRSGIDFGSKASLAIRRWTEQIEAFAQRQLLNKDAPQCRLADAQFVIARSHGFESWHKFSKHLDGLSHKTSFLAKFETATDAICNGDVK